MANLGGTTRKHTLEDGRLDRNTESAHGNLQTATITTENGNITGRKGTGYICTRVRLRLQIGSVYKGQFKNFLKHGTGEERFSNGDVYIGQYADGRCSGNG